MDQNTQQLAVTMRRHLVEMTYLGKSSHIGSALSIVDLLAVLYRRILKVDPKKPNWENRDRFILSKGHAGAAVYAILAECDFFEKDILKTHCQNGSQLSGHVSSHHVPGIDVSTGSLGHGLSIGAGMAYDAKLKNKKHRVFVLMSDGDCQEGSSWEAALFSSQHKLDNLIVIVDYNKLQALGRVKDILNLEPFVNKWEAFGWAVQEIEGHDHEAIYASLSNLPFQTSKPTCIIAHTVKGKGISFMEDNLVWHYRSPRDDDYKKAIEELGRD